MNKVVEFELTRQHELKPSLKWCGRILGCDVYIDTHDDLIRDRAEEVLQYLTAPKKSKIT